ncbi:MAG: prepilin peptidase, partial [Lachnospiraceae bacterium]|nr:prepilin peptidase [Lachnospiraceae bacterium]
GDIKLMAVAGLLVGWKNIILSLGLGCVLGSVIHVALMKIQNKDRMLAFGPYLSLGIYLSMICGEELISWYLNMFMY